ncbi:MULTISPECIES: post-transcriptional regulator [Aerococcus]|uniref:Post-transcriptional regulator n=1 Tax=Aerococcus loyolae TaxID=2976809 RepID=A0ABT4BXV4_9LACT|nr:MULTISPECIES: post-transcriptional regulator [Aerococcus]MCY3025096.1 post-transcriptional regulator [Aerococcus loyolae]MCY3028155.1 post-transcriptional regulator [Aerococcus loyolae]MCY3029187.1 post-transcriptional regulator [Aerococcus loyolae]MDK6232109.1 post-transcriptional regulator [Aerococcus urinae]MDK6257665.1 post-transcriptional regulator [Aerococcus urinae]
MKKTNNSLSKWQSLLIQPLCQKKAREFKRAGYPKISRQDVEKYFTDFAWKHQLPASYQERKQAIKQLTINQYFDYLQLEATVYDVPSLDHIDIQSLL